MKEVTVRKRMKRGRRGGVAESVTRGSESQRDEEEIVDMTCLHISCCMSPW